MGEPGKQYGLILPASKKPQTLQLPLKRAAIFDDNSEEEDNGTEDLVKKSFQSNAQKSLQQKHAKSVIRKALEEDPSVFEYDSVYSDIERVKEEQSKKDNKEKKPKYIASLMKSAENRKREQEWRMERKVQKEREIEGDTFADKEAFVTDSYRQKMEEMQQVAQKEEQEARIEALTDVTKQNDLGGFYRHLYKQQVTGENFEIKEEKIDKIKEEKDEENPGMSNANEKKTPKHKGREYRKREESDTSSSSDESEQDVDTDIDMSDSLSQHSNESIESKQTNTISHKKENIEEHGNASEILNDTPSLNQSGNSIEDTQETAAEKETARRNIWGKRTVGDAFIAAQERYRARCAMRLSA